MAFPIPASLEVKLTAGDVTCNCCSAPSTPEEGYVVPKDYIPSNVLSKMVYPNQTKTKEAADAQRLYEPLEKYLAKKVGDTRATEILAEKTFPLKLKDMMEKITTADREAMQKSLEESSPSFFSIPEILRDSKAKGEMPKVIGEYPGSFNPPILASKIARTTEATPEQIQEITQKIQHTLLDSGLAQVESTLIKNLLIQELRSRHIKAKTD